MKRLQLLFFGLFTLVTAHMLQADVATEGEKGVRVELLNGADFPGFKFFIKYQHYHYNMGYQKGEVNDVVLEKGKIVETGDRYSSSLLYAVDDKGNEFVSKEEIGGSVIDHAKSASYHLHQIKVLNVKDGTIEFKVAAKKKMNEKDEVVKVMRSEVGGITGSGEMNWTLVVVPIVCVLGLIAFFIVRRSSKPVS
jgi:hypothetical protein